MSAIVKSPSICRERISHLKLRVVRSISFSRGVTDVFSLSLCGRTRRRLVRSHTDMPGKATPEYAQTGKPKQAFTPVQQRAVFEERIQLEVRRLPWGCWA